MLLLYVFILAQHSGSYLAFGHPSILYAKSLIPELFMVNTVGELNGSSILYYPTGKRDLAPNTLSLDSPERKLCCV